MSYGSVNYGSAKSSSSAAEPPQPCPEGCDGCCEELQVDAEFGGTNTFCVECGAFDPDATVFRDGCTWSAYWYAGYCGMELRCIDSEWQLTTWITGPTWEGSWKCQWIGTRPNTDDCPPLGDWTDFMEVDESETTDCRCTLTSIVLECA